MRAKPGKTGVAALGWGQSAVAVLHGLHEAYPVYLQEIDLVTYSEKNNTCIVVALVSLKIPVVEELCCWPHVVSHRKPSSIVVSGEISNWATCSKTSNDRAPIHIGLVCLMTF